MQLDAIREKLLTLDTACLCDANKELRVMDPAIRPIRLGVKLIGRAYTVACEEDFLTVIKALRDARPGDVLVVDTRGSRRAVVGELFSTEAWRKGLAGIVVDGAVRDTAQIRCLPIPVYFRTIIPVAGTTQRIFETQISVSCGGVAVNPDDILFGDDDGIVVATAQELVEAIPVAEAIQSKEETALSRMREGASLAALGAGGFPDYQT
jgi:RraA family protein